MSQRWHHDPNLRTRADDYPVEVTDAEILPQMFAGVGRLDAALRRALPAPAAVRLPRPHAGRCRRRLADHLRRPAAVLRAHRSRPRRLGPRRRSGAATRRRAAAAAAPHQRVRAQGGGGHERARLALVAGPERDRVARLPQPAALRPLRHLRDRLPARRQGQRRPDALARGDQARSAAGDRRPRPRGHRRRGRPRPRRHLPRPGRRRASPGGRHRRARRQRRRHAAADAAVDLAAASGRARQLVRPGRAAADAASDRRRRGRVRRRPRGLEGPGRPADPLVPVLRHRHRPRVRARRQVAGDADAGTAPHDLAARRRAVRHGRGGARCRSTCARHIGRCIDWGAITEDLPDEANGVTLDPVVRDGDGIPAPHITYTVAENNWRQLDWHLDRITEAHLAGGARATYRLRICNDQPGHLLGTARMGTDPATSVCDPWGRTHDVPNLFVVDGSLFVTARRREPDLDHLRARPAHGRAHRRHGLASRRSRRDAARTERRVRPPRRRAAARDGRPAGAVQPRRRGEVARPGAGDEARPGGRPGAGAGVGLDARGRCTTTIRPRSSRSG